jgi:hypothetical protein
VHSPQWARPALPGASTASKSHHRQTEVPAFAGMTRRWTGIGIAPQTSQSGHPLLRGGTGRQWVSPVRQ